MSSELLLSTESACSCCQEILYKIEPMDRLIKENSDLRAQNAQLELLLDSLLKYTAAELKKLERRITVCEQREKNKFNSCTIQ